MRALPVVAMGLCTPIGTSLQMTVTSMRAGIARFAETEVVDDFGEPVRASRLSPLESSLSRTERMMALGCEALAGVVELLARVRTWQVPLYLGLPEKEPSTEVNQKALLAALQARAGVRLGVASIHEGGRAAFFEALEAARTDLRSGRAGPVALVGAVDSLCDGATLRALAEQRLHLGSQNPEGRIPGEAAGFTVLGHPDSVSGLRTMGVVLGGAIGVEPLPFAQQAPSLAQGLTEVFQRLRFDAITGARRVDAVQACQTGEAFWATEFTRAYLRNAALMPEPLQVVVAGESLGDCGAGAGPVMVGAALYRTRRQPHGGMRSLVYGSSDGGRLGACVVESV